MWTYFDISAGAYPGQAAAGYYPDGTSSAAVPPAYDYSSYYNYGQGYPGYAYPGYGYPGYDYSSYYGQAADWSNYQQSYSQSYPGLQLHIRFMFAFQIYETMSYMKHIYSWLYNYSLKNNKHVRPRFF